MDPRAKVETVPAGLEALQALVDARTPEARQLLFEQMVSLLLNPALTLGVAERQTIAAIAGELLRFAGDTSRAEAAERLAQASDPPIELLTKLALDELEIARPILMRNGALSEDALLTVAREGSSAHRCLIAEQEGLSRAVAAEIAGQDDLAAVEKLALNQSADLGEATLNRIATLSQRSPALAKILLARKDLSSVVAHRMFWWLSGSARRHVIEKHAIDLNDLEKVLSEAGRNGVIKVPDHMATKRLVDTISIQSRIPVSGLIEVMRQGSLERFTWALCERLSIEFPTGKRIVADPGGEALAVACRALRAEKSQFINLFLLIDFKRSRRARPASDINDIAALYERVSHHRATASLALWNALER